MSLAKARERQLEQPVEQPEVDATMLCDVEGCGRWWTVCISHGRKCGQHQREAERARVGLPPQELIAARLRRAPVAHWQDVDRDEAAA